MCRLFIALAITFAPALSLAAEPPAAATKSSSNADKSGLFQRGLKALGESTLTEPKSDDPAVAGAADQTIDTGLDGLASRLGEMLGSKQDLPADVVYVRVHRRVLERTINRPVREQKAVNDVIVGTPVQGRADLSGNIHVRFVPAKDHAVIEILFDGQIQANTVGNGGPVQVHAVSTTSFDAASRIVLDREGFEVQPAVARAKTTTTINGVTSGMPGLRGRVAQRVGTQQTHERLAQAEAESARKTELRISKEFGQAVMDAVGDAESQGEGLFAALPKLLKDRKSFDVEPWFATSSDYLQVCLVRGKGQFAKQVPPQPRELGNPDIAVHIHSSLVARAVSDPEVRKQVQPVVGRLLGRNDLQFVSADASTGGGPRLEPSADGAWWNVTWQDLTKRAVPAAAAHAVAKPPLPIVRP